LKDYKRFVKQMASVMGVQTDTSHQVI